MAGPGWASAALLVSVVVVGDGTTGAQNPTPAPAPSPTPLSRTPIADSIEPAVERFVRTHASPCPRAEPEVPCFPVSIEVQGRVYSVVESLRDLELDDRPSPRRPPTAAEMAPYRPGSPLSPSAGVGIDPGCAVKALLKKIGGRSRTYYLYRVRDPAGERVFLRDRPLEKSSYDAVPGVEYEPLGQFDDECEAVKAYLRALRSS